MAQRQHDNGCCGADSHHPANMGYLYSEWSCMNDMIDATLAYNSESLTLLNKRLRMVPNMSMQQSSSKPSEAIKWFRHKQWQLLHTSYFPNRNSWLADKYPIMSCILSYECPKCNTLQLLLWNYLTAWPVSTLRKGYCKTGIHMTIHKHFSLPGKTTYGLKMNGRLFRWQAFHNSWKTCCFCWWS